MAKLTDKERSKLNKEGKCKRCKEKGVYMIDPYAKDMYDEEYLVCLCDNCRQDSIGDI